jgi:hypothetical protein
LAISKGYIPQECINILEVLSKKTGGDPNENELAGYFRMNKERMKYFLDILLENKMVNRTMTINSPSTYYLTKSGRKFLFENNLL